MVLPKKVVEYLFGFAIINMDFKTMQFVKKSLLTTIFSSIFCRFLFSGFFIHRFFSYLSIQLYNFLFLNQYMFKQVSGEQTQSEIQQWYRYQQDQVELKFKDLHTDALEQIKNKIRRKQTLQQKDENIQILERERSKIIDQMKLHVKQCEHPHCKSVDEIVLMYNLRNLQNVKQDSVHLINKYGECTGYVKTDCPVGSEINNRMLQTHRLLKNQMS